MEGRNGGCVYIVWVYQISRSSSRKHDCEHSMNLNEMLPTARILQQHQAKPANVFSTH